MINTECRHKVEVSTNATGNASKIIQYSVFIYTEAELLFYGVLWSKADE